MPKQQVTTKSEFLKIVDDMYKDLTHEDFNYYAETKKTIEGLVVNHTIQIEKMPEKKKYGKHDLDTALEHPVYKRCFAYAAALLEETDRTQLLSGNNNELQGKLNQINWNQLFPDLLMQKKDDKSHAFLNVPTLAAGINDAAEKHHPTLKNAKPSTSNAIKNFAMFTLPSIIPSAPLGLFFGLLVACAVAGTGGIALGAMAMAATIIAGATLVHKTVTNSENREDALNDIAESKVASTFLTNKKNQQTNPEQRHGEIKTINP